MGLDRPEGFPGFEGMTPGPGGVERTHVVLDEILAERGRQEAKWGQQNHPSFDQVLLTREGGCTPERMAEEYEVPSEVRGKFICQTREKRGEQTFADILVEEVAEAVATCNDPESVTRAELVQCAAVVVAWIEAIDRRTKAKLDAALADFHKAREAHTDYCAKINYTAKNERHRKEERELRAEVERCKQIVEELDAGPF